jgi:hypothetical protein
VGGVREKVGVIVKDAILVGVEGSRKNVSLVLKVPRQCPLVLLAEVMHMIIINSSLICMASEEVR